MVIPVITIVLPSSIVAHVSRMKSLFVGFFLFATAVNAYKIPVIEASFNGAVGNLVEVARNLELNDLLKVATEVGLAETLASQGPFTVFGPTDKAFKEIPPLVLELILKDNKTAVKDLLLFHVLNGEVRSTAIKNDLLVQTLFSEKKVRFNVYNGNPNIMVTYYTDINFLFSII